MSRRRRPAARSSSLLLVLAVAVGAAGCSVGGGGSEDGDGLQDGPRTLRILAGSEIQDLEPLLARAEEQIDVRVELEYTGTLDGAERISSGGTDGGYDAAWFSSDRYLALLPEAGQAIGPSSSIMASPVVLGLRRSVVADLGWDSEPPTWAQIADAAEAGEFTFGMTNPASSNTGFSALIGVATAVAGTGQSLVVDDIPEVAPELEGFFSGQELTAGSSGWLADEFVARQTEPDQAVDGMINYESVLLDLEADGVLEEPLDVVYPADGIVTADYPLQLLSSAEEPKRALYDELVAWLLAPEQQEAIMAETLRRPVVPGVEPAAAFGDRVLIDLPFPNQLAVADGLISAYLNEIRGPAQTVYVLDTSGSMQGDRLDDLKQSFANLAGGDDSTTGQFAQFRNRETVAIIEFYDAPQAPVTFVVPATGGDEVRQEITTTVDGFEAGGGTAVYDSLQAAYEQAARLAVADPDAYTSIVLMSDGENTEGGELGDFERWLAEQPAAVQDIPTFPVVFGESDAAELDRVAELTDGRAFAAADGELAQAFKEIRGYQ